MHHSTIYNDLNGSNLVNDNQEVGIQDLVNKLKDV